MQLCMERDSFVSSGECLHLVGSGFTQSTHQLKLDKSILRSVLLHLLWGYTRFFSIYPMRNITWTLTLNIWHCPSLVLMPISANFLGYWHIHQKNGKVGFYDSASFPISRLFSLTPDIIYLLAFLKDSFS